MYVFRASIFFIFENDKNFNIEHKYRNIIIKQQLMMFYNFL